jgi:hypothetical protein
LAVAVAGRRLITGAACLPPAPLVLVGDRPG